MQKVLLFFLIFTLSTVLLAQPAQPGIDKLLVPVVNDKQLPVADATVELLRSKDSVLIKAAITDTSGLASFQQVAAGVYLLRVSSVNYGTHYSSPVQVLADESNERLAAIVLYPANTHLQALVEMRQVLMCR